MEEHQVTYRLLGGQSRRAGASGSDGPVRRLQGLSTREFLVSLNENIVHSWLTS